MKQQMEELKNKKRQKGFTLIELIMVIVILGILAAVAVPQFVDLSGDAEDAAIEAIAGTLTSASASNAAICAIDSTQARCIAITNCNTAGGLLDGGLVPTGYTLNDAAVANGATATCTLTHTASAKTANFTLRGVTK